MLWLLQEAPLDRVQFTGTPALLYYGIGGAIVFGAIVIAIVRSRRR